MNERQLENWICNNFYTFLERLNESDYGYLVPLIPTQLIGRQITLSHGRLDILAWQRGPLVIELKARELKGRDLGQILRYMADVKYRMIDAYLEQFYQLPRPNRLDRELEYIKKGMQDRLENCQGWLVGRKAPENVVAAADGAGVHCVEWEPTTAGPLFEYAHNCGFDSSSLPDWADEMGRIAKAEVIADRDEFISPSNWYKKNGVLYRAFGGWNKPRSMTRDD